MNDVEKDVSVEKKLMKYFNCDGNYFVKAAVDCGWRIKEIDGNYFVAYWKEGEAPTECVVVKKNSEPLIFKKSDYTMIICIECVKIALVLKNSNNM